MECNIFISKAMDKKNIKQKFIKQKYKTKNLSYVTKNTSP